MTTTAGRCSLGTPRKIFGEIDINVSRSNDLTTLPQKKLHQEEKKDAKNEHNQVVKDVYPDASPDLELTEQDEKKLKFKKVCEYRVGEDVNDTLCEHGIQEWSVDDFEYVKHLGKGGQGTVFYAREKQSGFAVALKVQEADDNAVCELDLHQSLIHPNIVTMYDYFYSTQYFGPKVETHDSGEKRKYIYMILELCNGASLYEGIIDNTCEIDDIEEQAAFFFRGILNATEYLHEKGIIHCDMKSDNILINQKIAKVTDFGMAVYNEEKEIIGGSPAYMSPEHLMAWRHMSDNFDHRADIYSLGVILYEMLCGYLPYKVIKEGQCLDESEDEDDIDAYIDEGYPILDLRTLNDYTSDEPFYIPPPIFTEEISEEGQDLVLRLMEPSVEKRITIAEVKDHPWLKRYL